MKRYYRRNLPHWQPEHAVFSVTFRLAGSLPRKVIETLVAEREINSQQWQIADWNNYFHKYDQLLDHPTSGPTWLKEPEIAKIVKEALHFRDEKHYRLIAYCVMSNHVHLIVDKTTKILFRILQSLKRHTATRANEILKTPGKPFWQKESYDHMIRDYQDMCHHTQYTVYNAVAAQLVEKWNDFPHVYLRRGFERYL